MKLRRGRKKNWDGHFYIQACSYIQRCPTHTTMLLRKNLSHTHALLHTDVMHTNTFTHKDAFTHKILLDTKGFWTHRLLYTWTVLCTPLRTTPFYSQNERFYTETPLHTDTVSDTHFYTQTLLHTNTFTQKPLHTNAFTHRSFHTQTLLHTNTFTDKRFYTQTLLHTTASTQTLWHTNALTHQRFCTKALLHTNASTHKHFYTQGESATAGPNKLAINPQLLSLEPHFVRKGCRRRHKVKSQKNDTRTSFRAKGWQYCGASSALPAALRRKTWKRKRRRETVTEGKREREKMWRCVKMCGYEDVTLRRCEDVWRCEDVSMWR